jgi:hypothetical protein
LTLPSRPNKVHTQEHQSQGSSAKVAKVPMEGKSTIARNMQPNTMEEEAGDFGNIEIICAEFSAAPTVKSVRQGAAEVDARQSSKQKG